MAIFGVVAYQLRPSFEGLVPAGDEAERCLADLVRECWASDPRARPSAHEVADTLYTWFSYY